MKTKTNPKNPTTVDMGMSYAAIQHRCQSPLKMSVEYTRAIEDCEKELAARHLATASRSGGPSIQLEPVHLAWGVAAMIIVGLFLWIGLSLAEAAWSLGL